MEKAAVSLMISLVSPVITKLTETYFGGDVTKAEIDKLKSVNIPLISRVIREAEKIKPEDLKPWLMNLKEIAYEAEDLLDMYEYKRIEKEISSSPSSVKKLKNKTKELFSRVMLKTELRTILEKIQQSADDAIKTLIPLLQLVSTNSILQLVSTNSTIQPRSVVSQKSTTVSGMTSEIFGRDEERDYLINLLIHKPNESSSSNTSSRKRIPVYSLYGIGGAGKTTLAQYIYNDESVKSHFNERIWIEVTHNFNAEKITREIIHSIDTNASTSSDVTFDMLQNKLKLILPSKKILLVLDNIWCERKEFWDQLLIPLNEVGEYGCRILITARSEKVGLDLNVNINMPLKELENDDCWLILLDHATDGSRKIITDPELIDVGKKIVSKLKKSPLALRMVGSLLGKKIDVKEWEQILKQDMLKETIDVLYFSFQNLPIHLQRCFAYCSLYPKGWYFNDERVECLVRQWIAAGFVEPLKRSELTLEEWGMKYFDDLVSYSFFQKSSWYVIHDLLHDLAEMFSKNSCFRIESDEQFPILTTIKHLSITSYKEGIVHISDILNLVNLHTFVVLSEPDFYSEIIVEEFNEICKKLTKLRVLVFCKPLKIQRLDSVGELKLLRYLKLYHVENLPESFGKLYHLQYLHISNELFTVPKSFRNLVNLRRFSGFGSTFYYVETDNSRCYGHGNSKLSKMLNIAKLISLEQLNDFYPQKNAEYGMKQLENLQQLRGKLNIYNLENVNNEVEATEARVKRKSYLRRLVLEWDESQETKVATNTYEEVLKGLEPHPNLKELVIKNFMGLKSPKWMVYFPDHLPNLQNLTLSSCENLTDLHHLPHHLQILRLEDCPKLNQLSSFPCSLVHVEILNCPKLEDKLCLLTKLKLLSKLRLEGFSHLRILPDLNPPLQHLRIVNCPELISMGNIESLASLTHLKIENCPELISMGNIESLAFLTHLTVFGCPMFHDLPSLSECLCLEALEIDGCYKIVSLPNLPPSLKYLWMINCPELKYLPILPTSMISIRIYGCDPELEMNYRVGGPLRHKIDHIPIRRIKYIKKEIDF